MPDLDLAVRVRDYARDKGRASVVVSSAWLAREFDVDPRTIAAALRPYGVAPGEVERGVRGYSIAELAGMVLAGEVPDDYRVRAESDVVRAAGVEVDSAIVRLSAGAGHDMTPALRAAGLL